MTNTKHIIIVSGNNSFKQYIISQAMVIAQPANITQFIKVDQFGYLCDARKIAVISDPIIGFNSAETFNR